MAMGTALCGGTTSVVNEHLAPGRVQLSAAALMRWLAAFGSNSIIYMGRIVLVYLVHQEGLATASSLLGGSRLCRLRSTATAADSI